MTKAIDRLECIAHREQISALQRTQDRELAGIGVLELVDHHQLEPLGPGPAHRLVIFEERARAELEVVEIDGAAPRLQQLVLATEALQQLAEQGTGPRTLRIDLTGLLGSLFRRRLPEGLLRRSPLQAHRLENRLRQRRLKHGRGQPRQTLSLAAQLRVHIHHHRVRAVGAPRGHEVDRLAALALEKPPQRGRPSLSP
jgi:hypothetical protein